MPPTATTTATATATATEKRPLGHTLLAGGTAGLVESSICHPLDTIKTRMQLRNNHVESVSNRLRHSLVEPAVFHVRHSLVEPALRLRLGDNKHSFVEPASLPQRNNKHSFVEPAHLVQLKHHRHRHHHNNHHHSYAEPSLIRVDVVNAANTANGSAATYNNNNTNTNNTNTNNTPESKAGSKGSNAAVASKTRVAAPVSGARRPERPVAVNAAKTKNASSSPWTKKPVVARNSSAANCWWNLPRHDPNQNENHKRKRSVHSSKRTFLSSVQPKTLPGSIVAGNPTVPVYYHNMPTTTTVAAPRGCGNRDQGFGAGTNMTNDNNNNNNKKNKAKHSVSFSTSAPSGPKSASRCWWNPPNRKPHRTTTTSTADASHRSFQTRRVLGPLANSTISTSSSTATNACRTTSGGASASAAIGHPPSARACGGSGAASCSALVPNSKAWWNWHKHLPSTIVGRGQSSKSAVWWQPMNETCGRRTHATIVNNSSNSNNNNSMNNIKMNNHKPTSVVIRKGPLGPIQTARRIIQKEGFLSLYKGLSAVYVGIIPKMAIRFVSFEQYRDWIKMHSSLSTGGTNFTAGLLTGLTEAVLIVTPADVCKIRMQSQRHSLLDPLEANTRKYGNVIQTAVTIVREEGSGALYKGVVPTMLRQGCNQAVNFTAYNAMKSFWLERQRQEYYLQSNDCNNEEQAVRIQSPGPHEQLSGTMSLLIGGLSGAMGPVVNNPLDVVKTRLQKQNITKNANMPPKYTGLVQACFRIANEEGAGALWKGITPRLMRIVPGQAITFTTYEAVCRWL